MPLMPLYNAARLYMPLYAAACRHMPLYASSCCLHGAGMPLAYRQHAATCPSMPLACRACHSCPIRLACPAHTLQTRTHECTHMGVPTKNVRRHSEQLLDAQLQQSARQLAVRTCTRKHVRLPFLKRYGPLSFPGFRSPDSLGQLCWRAHRGPATENQGKIMVHNFFEKTCACTGPRSERERSPYARTHAHWLALTLTCRHTHVHMRMHARMPSWRECVFVFVCARARLCMHAGGHSR